MDFGPPPFIWLLADEISAKCLAGGIVTARLQEQAKRLVEELDAKA